MLPIQHRLKDRKKINRLFKEGKSFAGKVMFVKILPQEKDKPTQFSFGAGLKYSKKAVERNQIKRWMREVVRLRIKEIKPGWQVGMSPNSKISPQDARYQLVLEEVENLLKKAKILP